MNVDQAARDWAQGRIAEIEEHFGSDVLTVIGPIAFGLENVIRSVMDDLADKKDSVVVVLDTPGGVAEVAERIARGLRNHYNDVRYLVPDRAMSAGTILVMSGDAILMDRHSCLGPIDPQVERDGRLVPALSYLAKFDQLIEKSQRGELTTAEIVLLQKLDLAELHQFELARDLSISLLKEWLSRYKFKDWKSTESRGIEVTDEMKEERAAEIAEALNNHERWHTHGRGIDKTTLQDELKLKIDGYDEVRELVWDYLMFIKDVMNKKGYASFIHTREFF